MKLKLLMILKKINESRIIIPISLIVAIAATYFLIDIKNIYDLILNRNFAQNNFDIFNFVAFALIILILIGIVINHYHLDRVKKGNVGIFILINGENKKEYEEKKEKICKLLTRIFMGNIERVNYEVTIPPFHKVKKINKLFKNTSKVETYFKGKNNVFAIKLHENNKNDGTGQEQYVIEYFLINNSKTFNENKKIKFIKNNINEATAKYPDVMELHYSNIEDGLRYVLAKLFMKANYLDISEELFSDLSYDADNAQITEIKSSINKDLFKVNLLGIYYYFHKYLEKNEEYFLIEMSKRIDGINKYKSNSFQYYIFTAIYIFLKYKDTKQALEVLEECKIYYRDENNLVLMEAFLDLYSGRISNSYRKFNSVCKRNITAEKIYNFEELMKGIVRMEPIEYHLNLGLGIINYEIRKNNTLAEKYYKEFLKTSKYQIDKPIELDIYLKLANIKNITI